MKKYLKTIPLLGLLYACSPEEFSDVEIRGVDGDYAIPLVHSTFTTPELLNLGAEAYVEVIDPNTNLLAVTYNDGVKTYSLSDFINFNNISVQETFSQTITPPPTPSTVTIPYNFTIEMSDGALGSELTSLLFQSGEMLFNLSSTSGTEVNYTIDFPSVSLNGNSLQIIGSTTSGIISADLNGYEFDLTQTPQQYNSFPVNATFEITLDNNSNPYQQIDMDFNFRDLIPESIEGYMGSITATEKLDTIDVDIFKNDIEGQFQLFEPTLNVYYTNQMGAPISLMYSQFTFTDTETGQDHNFLGPTFVNPVYMMAAPDANSSTTAHSLFDNSNSAIEQIMNERPKKIQIEFSPALNPQSIVDRNQFINYDDSIKVSTDITIPLKILATGFSYSDTVDFNLTQDSINGLNTMNLTLVCNNFFPFDLGIEIEFLDDNNNTVYSIFDLNEPFVSSAEVNVDGFAVTPTQTLEEIEFDNSKLQEITNADKVIFTARLDTENANLGQPASFSEDNWLEIKAGLRVGTNL